MAVVGGVEMDCAREMRRDPVLEVEDVLSRAIIALGPKLGPYLGIDQSHADTQPIPSPANGPFDHA
ncbi:hypothetical protein [Rhizobium leguminosarum]|uniref:hypothetical protein n=1 Tax=Rhizobium leguminosarum TaxID=384 RepID=UPI001C91E272|nr:hypothetical protein [Rhizobium leguminosarum]MBY2912099.1 hypothetical protein [Rhizobium leguminosarum]